MAVQLRRELNMSQSQFDSVNNELQVVVISETVSDYCHFPCFFLLLEIVYTDLC